MAATCRSLSAGPARPDSRRVAVCGLMMGGDGGIAPDATTGGIMQLVYDTLQRVTLGPEVSFENLAVFPLLDRTARARDYLTLREALAAGTVRITEKSASGSVAELMVVNEGDQPLLLLDGEQLVGAK